MEFTYYPRTGAITASTSGFEKLSMVLKRANRPLPRVPVLFGGHNLPPLVEIGLTDVPNFGGAMAPPAPPGTTGLPSRGLPTLIDMESTAYSGSLTIPSNSLPPSYNEVIKDVIKTEEPPPSYIYGIFNNRIRYNFTQFYGKH